MRLGKRTFSAVLAWTLASAVAGTGISVPVPQKMQAAETKTEAETAAALAEEEIAPEAEETETAVVIDKVTIADTYYSVDGKLPLYVEYFTAEALDYEQYDNLKLTVTKEDGTIAAEAITDRYNSSVSFGSFQFEECEGVEIGKTYPLTFVIKDMSSGKELFKETKEVGFEEKDAWVDRAYLPTNQTSYNICLYIASEAAVKAASSIDGVCLLDKDNQVAADGNADAIPDFSADDNRYGTIFYQNPYHTGWKYVDIFSYSVYRTRKLQAGEVLTVAYSVDGMVIPTDCKVTVTDQPYITSFYETLGTYSGEEYAETVVLQGLHINFDQVSFVLKDRRTGKEVARSVSSITDSSNSAYYAVVWNEEYKDKKPVECDIEYQYADKEKQLIAEQENRRRFFTQGTEDILWNPKTDSIEYHNSELPAGAEVSYRVRLASSEEVTGSGITVDSNHHMEVELKETFLYQQWVDLYVSYLDAEGNERTVSDDVMVYQNKQPTDSGSGGINDYFIYSSIMNPMYYLSDSACAFSPELICNDESKLVTTESAVIYDTENQEAGTVELSREKLNGDRFVYKGTYKDGLTPGKYRLKFAPDKNYEASYDFYVQDKTILGLYRMDENIYSGYIRLSFTSEDIAEWYCSEENQKKLSVKLLDIHNREIAAYTWKDGDFTVEDENTYYWWISGNGGSYSSVPKRLVFSKKVKEELDKIYYCNVCVYYDGKEAVYAEYPTDVIRDTYIRPADSESSWIEMGYDNKYVSPEKGKYTYNCIRGNESAFPAVLTITDWYSMKTIKEIPIEAAGILKEEDLQGLSGNKVYSCYLKGADGSVSHSEGYLSKDTKYHYYHPFWTSFSDLYPVSGDFDVTFEFTNKSDEYTNYENYLVCFTNAFEAVSKIPSENEGYQAYYILRADSWGWSDLDVNITLEGNPVNYTYDWTWEQFKDIMKDAKVTMNIKRTGDDFVVDAKILGADGKNYSYVTKFTTKADKEMTIFFTCEHADVSILSFQDNKAVQPPEQGGGGIVVVPPQLEITKPAEETKPEETPSEDTNKEETKPEETPSEDTNKEETPEKTPAEDTGKEETKEPEKEGNKKPEKDKANTKAKGKLTLKKTKLVISKGQKAKIKITSKLNTGVTYKSLNKKVAAVSSKGVVTAKKKGKAVIVVKANGKRRKVTVTVKGASAEAKNGVKLKKDFSLSVSKAVLKKGSKLAIQQASGISGKVTYRSLNKKIATVSAKGMIKARKKGKTAIVVKNGKKTIKLKITVTI